MSNCWGEGGVYQLLVGRGLSVPLAVACLAYVQGRWVVKVWGEGAPAITGVVAHVVAEQADPLWEEDREGGG